jgi:hypothetical protein
MSTYLVIVFLHKNNESSSSIESGCRLERGSISGTDLLFVTMSRMDLRAHPDLYQTITKITRERQYMTEINRLPFTSNVVGENLRA